MIVSGLSRLASTMPQPQLARRPARPGAREVRRQRALEPLLRERAGVAQQAKPDLAVGDDRAAARRIARRCRSARPGSRRRRSRKAPAPLRRARRRQQPQPAAHRSDAPRQRHSAEDFGGDRPEPGIGDSSPPRARIAARRIERADAAGALDIGELPVRRADRRRRPRCRSRARPGCSRC